MKASSAQTFLTCYSHVNRLLALTINMLIEHFQFRFKYFFSKQKHKVPTAFSSLFRDTIHKWNDNVEDIFERVLNDLMARGYAGD